MAGLSINEVTTYRWSFEQDVAGYRECGIEAIGVWRQKLADFGEAKGVELLTEAGLSVSNLLWAGGFTGSEGRSYQESIADAREALQLAAALRTHHVILYTGARSGHTQNHARRLFSGALRELLPQAAELDVTLTVEPMHPRCAEDWTFLTSLDEAMALVEGIDNPYLKLAFDTYHWGNEPQIAERIGEFVQHVGIVHLGDARSAPDSEQNRLRLGEGTVPLACILNSLRQAGYQGYYDVELFGEEIEDSDYRQLLECSKRSYERLLES